MKKITILFTLLMVFALTVSAQKTAQIKFDKTSHNFGTFSTKNAVQKCTFTFTNVGDAPLVIHQAIASCGCTVPAYTKTPIAPGAKGKVDVTFNGNGRFDKHIKKVITVYTNGTPETVRLTIEGDMVDEK
ncbi:MAG: DUF1573 domain-containing protein [Bacteroidaceae bacterium]|nr:DUF1573 domain-containing protein [Bacteroidaceae bacterium]